MADNCDPKDTCGSNNVPDEQEKAKQSTLGRRLSRRLSIMTKVPSILNAKLKQEIFKNGSDAFYSERKSLDVTVIAPDKTQRIVLCQRGQTVFDVVNSIIEEFSLKNPKLYLAGSLAAVNPEVDALLLDDNILIIEELGHFISDDATEFTKRTEEFVLDEAEFVKALHSASELYDNSLSRNSDDPCNLTVIFQNLISLAYECSCLLNDMKSILTAENSSCSEICRCFSDKFWEEYDDYLRSYRRSKRLLRQKKSQDEDFVQLCKLRQGAAKYSLEQIVDLPKLQNISSPVGSPVSSPITSPKNGRRRYAKTPTQRRQSKQEYREVQSEPEDGGGGGSGSSEASKKSKIRRKIDKSRNGRTLEISGPFHLQCSKSMGRLDGLKQVS